MNPSLICIVRTVFINYQQSSHPCGTSHACERRNRSSHAKWLFRKFHRNSLRNFANKDGTDTEMGARY